MEEQRHPVDARTPSIHRRQPDPTFDKSLTDAADTTYPGQIMTNRKSVPSTDIRPAHPGDLDAIASLQSRSIMAFGQTSYGEEACTAWAKVGVQMRHTLLASGSFFVAERDAELIGVAGWTADSRDEDGAWARYVFVDPAAAGQGLGRMLMTTLERSASLSGRRRMSLFSSLNAIGFYQALDYRRIKPARWPIADGIEMDYLLMEKAILGTEDRS